MDLLFYFYIYEINIVKINMKHLQEYIFEHIVSIFEGFSSNWKHNHNGDDYYYPKHVIDDLLNDIPVSIGDVTSPKKFKQSNILLTKEMFDINVLKQLQNDLNDNPSSTSAEQFNKAFKDKNIKTNNIWKFVDRAKYSKGSSDGGNVEIVVCNAFNNNLSENEIINYANKYNVNIKTWLTSIQNTLKILHKWPNNKYVAIQVDGKGFDDIKNLGKLTQDELSNIAIAYSNKADIKKIFNINVDNLYPKTSKDSWNKADILLVDKTKNTYNEFVNALNKIEGNTNIDRSIEYNKVLIDFTMLNKIIPISLKKVPDANANLYKHNLDESEKSIAIEYNNIGADIELPATNLKGNDENDDKNGSLYLVLNTKGIPKEIGKHKYVGKRTENLFNIQFYKRASSSNIKPTAKIELAFKNSKGGSGYLQICHALKTTTDEINNYCDVSSKDKIKNLKTIIIDGINKYFGWNENNLPDVIKSANNWYMKPCFVVLIVLLNKYCEQFKITPSPDVLLPFTNFVIGACEGTGSYYIIK